MSEGSSGRSADSSVSFQYLPVSIDCVSYTGGALSDFLFHFQRRNQDCLDRVAEELCEAETITGDRLREIIAEYITVPQKLAVV